MLVFRGSRGKTGFGDVIQDNGFSATSIFMDTAVSYLADSNFASVDPTIIYCCLNVIIIPANTHCYRYVKNERNFCSSIVLPPGNRITIGTKNIKSDNRRNLHT